jgi:hypothetical protein
MDKGEQILALLFVKLDFNSGRNWMSGHVSGFKRGYPDMTSDASKNSRAKYLKIRMTDY